MALRDQPYLPLYVQDFLTDEKLTQCSASTVGVYIMLMCLMHKSDPYGTILLKQKDKQTDKQIKNFACKVAKNLPFSENVIEAAIIELIEEEVLKLNADSLEQKRMIKDCELSTKRAKSGKIGGKKSFLKKEFALNFAQANNKAKLQANSENENVNENKDEYVNGILKKEKRKKFEKPDQAEVIEFFESKGSSKIEAVKFWSYYESNGWRVGKNPMKSWTSAATGWMTRAGESKVNVQSKADIAHKARIDSGTVSIAEQRNREYLERKKQLAQ